MLGEDKNINKRRLKVKRKLFLIATMVLVLAGLLVPNVVVAADNTVAEPENSLAQKSAQAFLDSSTKLFPHWKYASLAHGEAYYNLDGQVAVYMFPVVTGERVMGRIVVGSSGYDFDVLEAGEAPPESLPNTSELKDVLERDLEQKVSTKDIGIPQLLYLGYGFCFAKYEVGGQSVAFSLLERFAVPAQKLDLCMATPEGYRKSKQMRGVTRSVMQISTRVVPLTWVDWENLPVPSQKMYDKVGYTGPYQNDCGPTSGAMVSEYYKEERGYSDFPGWPTDHHELYDEMDCNGGVTPWEACGGWESYAAEHDYSFEASYDVAYSWDYENTVQPRIDDQEPFMILFRASPYSQGTFHWCTLRGYGTWEETEVDYIFVNNPWRLTDNGELVSWDAEYAYITMAEIWDD
jgi:hypothetical protein